MTEVIVRMKMPTGCANCPMADDEVRFCKTVKEYIPMLGRPSWCPIKGELPDEHERLIDADALIDQIKSNYTEYPVMIEIRRALKKFIDEAPTIEPERKKGRWIDDCMCSECHWIHENDKGFALITNYNFCPNCGADMREVDNE